MRDTLGLRATNVRHNSYRFSLNLPLIAVKFLILSLLWQWIIAHYRLHLFRILEWKHFLPKSLHRMLALKSWVSSLAWPFVFSGCPPGRFGVNCDGVCTCVHGSCDFMTGACTCQSGFVGANCNQSKKKFTWTYRREISQKQLIPQYIPNNIKLFLEHPWSCSFHESCMLYVYPTQCQRVSKTKSSGHLAIDFTNVASFVFSFSVSFRYIWSWLQPGLHLSKWRNMSP